MIPGTGLYSRSTEKSETSQTTQTITQNDQTNKARIDIGSISIDIHGTVFAGTLLQIGNRTLNVEHTVAGQRFKLDNTKNHILAMPLR